jgi:hypothetical protein
MAALEFIRGQGIMADIQRANPRLRRRTISLLCALAAFAAVTLPFVPGGDRLPANPGMANVRASHLWATVAVVLVISVVGIGAHLAALGDFRFPPSA